MAKKQPNRTTKPSLRRKPSKSAQAAFVNGKKGAGATEDRERQTLLLPGPMRKALKMRAIEDGIEISQVVEAALIKYGIGS